MKHFYTILFLCVTLVSANGQWAQMTNSELSTVEYNGIVYTGSAVIIITDGGIFRSTDNGLNWSLSITGIDSETLNARGLAFVNSRTEVWVSVANKLYRSTNHGATWDKPALTGFTDFVWFDNLATIGNRLITQYSYFDIGLSAHITRLGYTDDGINWIAGPVLSIDNDSWWDFVPYHNNRALYIVEHDNATETSKLWYSADGNTKQLLPLTGLSSDPDINRRAFSTDTSGNTLLFVDENESKCYRYDFTTEKWEEKMNGLEIRDLSLAMLFKAHPLPDRLFVTALYADGDMNLVMTLLTSTDNGDNWTQVAAPGLSYPLFENQMIIASGGRIITEHFHSAIVYSDDNGQTWTKATGIQAGSFPLFTGTSNGDLFTVTQEQTTGILRSSDNGATWTQSSGNLVNFQGIYIIEGLQAGGNYLYVTAAENPFDQKPFLFLSTDFGENWTRLTNAPDSARKEFYGRSILWPVVRFSNNSDQGTYQMTKDAGVNWINLSPGIDVHNPDRVLGFTGNGTMGLLLMFAEKNGRPRVYLSENDGTTFTDITSNLDGLTYEVLVGNRQGWNSAPVPIAGFRQDGQEFYLAAYDYFEGGGNLFFFKLNEEKNGWIKMGTTGVALHWPIEFHSLLHRGGVWHLATSAAVYASIDNCINWVPIWNNEGFVTGTRPASFVQNGWGVFLGTYGSGVWKAQLTAPVIATLAATNISDTAAVSGGQFVSTGGLPIAGKGICWSISPNPTVSDNVIYIDNTWKDFTDTLRLLAPNTKYYVRAFAWSPKGMGQPVYGNEISFTTDQATRVDTEKGGSVLIFPNPSDGRFNILADADWNATIMDVTGKIVWTGRADTGMTEVSLRNPAPGIYFIKLTGKANEVQIIRLMIK